MLFNEIIECEKELRDIEMPALVEADFLAFRDTGNRLVYEGEYFGRRKYLTVYSILALHGKDLKDYAFYVQRLSQIIEAVLEEKCWALPAHVDFSKYGTEEMNLTVDLFAAETGGTLAELSVRLAGVLPADLIERMQSAVRYRVLDQFAAKAPYSWWETDRCNWSAVCAGNVGLAALFLDYDGASGNVVERCKESMKYFLAGYEDDGTCTEGLGYYGYGMSYFVAFLDELLKRGQGHEFLDMPKLREIARFPQKMYMPGGISVAFSDGGEHESYLPGLMNFMAEHFDGVVLPDASLARGFYEDNCYRFVTNERSIGVESSSKSAASDVNTEYLLPSAQWYVKSTSGFSFAAKGGNNDENHNHNDVGSFMLVLNGKQILAELGAGEYTKDYFTDKRYTILNNSSLGHNVPIISGCEQCFGADFKASKFELNESGALVIELSKAYESGLLESFERRLKIDGDEFVLEDVFARGNAGNITERFISYIEPEILSEDSLKIGEATLQFNSKEVKITKTSISNHEGLETVVYLMDISCENNQFFMKINS